MSFVKCDFCGKEFSPKGIDSHVWRVHGEGQNFVPGTKGKPAWNRGLTKTSDERVKKCGETFSKNYKDGKFSVWCDGLTKETSESLFSSSLKVSETVTSKVMQGDWHFSFSKTKTVIYKGCKLRGSWEYAYAQYLDAQNIIWEQPRESFPYEFEGKIRQYFPDFYLPQTDDFIEIKGYETEKDRAKWRQFPHTLKILRGEDLFNLHLIPSFKQVKS
jgi:hypothetical protein